MATKTKAELAAVKKAEAVPSAVNFYCTGAPTVAQAAFISQSNANVSPSYNGELTGRHVFARAEVEGYKTCPNAELFEVEES